MSGLLRVLSGRSRRPSGPRHRLVVATATTADGVTAHVRASYLLTITDDAAVDRGVEDVVEADLEWGLRNLIGWATVAELPTAGQGIDEVLSTPVAGARVEHLTAESTDVVVSPELRRLVLREP